jgi:hypothetical protein
MSAGGERSTIVPARDPVGVQSAAPGSGSKRREGRVGFLWTKRFGGTPLVAFESGAGPRHRPRITMARRFPPPRRVVEMVATSSCRFSARSHGSSAQGASHAEGSLARRGSRRDCQTPPEVVISVGCFLHAQSWNVPLRTAIAAWPGSNAPCPWHGHSCRENRRRRGVILRQTRDVPPADHPGPPEGNPKQAPRTA